MIVAAIAVVAVLIIAVIFLSGAASSGTVYKTDAEDMIIDEEDMGSEWYSTVPTSDPDSAGISDDDADAVSAMFMKQGSTSMVTVFLVKYDSVKDAKNAYSESKEAAEDNKYSIKKMSAGDQGYKVGASVLGISMDMVVFQKGNVVVGIVATGVSDSTVDSIVEAQDDKIA